MNSGLKTIDVADVMARLDGPCWVDPSPGLGASVIPNLVDRWQLKTSIILGKFKEFYTYLTHKACAQCQDLSSQMLSVPDTQPSATGLHDLSHRQWQAMNQLGEAIQNQGFFVPRHQHGDSSELPMFFFEYLWEPQHPPLGPRHKRWMPGFPMVSPSKNLDLWEIPEDMGNNGKVIGKLHPLDPYPRDNPNSS